MSYVQDTLDTAVDPKDEIPTYYAGDQEPPHDAELLDADGYLWKWHRGEGWRYPIEGKLVPPYAWADIPVTYFPMAEVAA